MHRDQRVASNAALLHAQSIALDRRVPVIVIGCLSPEDLGKPQRLGRFLLEGLQQVETRLRAAGFGFFLLQGAPVKTLEAFVKKVRAGLLVMDFSPLRAHRSWRDDLARALPVACHEVDAHNIVPAWTASPKLEIGARTFRPKIHERLADHLTELPALVRHPFPGPTTVEPLRWEDRLRDLHPNTSVPDIPGLRGGESAGAKALGLFLTQRLANYAIQRNDPTADATSALSAHLRFGHLSAQRVAWEVRRRALDTPAGDAFLEQVIVRRELSDNFCLYNPQYDTFDGFPLWAQKSLNAHRRDKRPFLYTPSQFKNASTHDPLWNAAQKEMVLRGRMPGYLRMYWAKKVLEWSPSPEEALATVLALNDTYEMDGRDPNGYAGAAWAIGGAHDRPWPERPVFGNIRYMNLNGCRTKFDVDAYIRRVESL
jgi:deoxyribodipyrimidine photo-lyase